jgi:hypothetical protein
MFDYYVTEKGVCPPPCFLRLCCICFVLCHLSVHISPCAIIVFLETISLKPNTIPAIPTAIATLAPSCTTTPAPADEVGAVLVVVAVTFLVQHCPLLGGSIVLPPPVTVVSGVVMAF